MRYPVEDEFAIVLVHHLYELLLAKGQPLARALQRALRKAAEAPGVQRNSSRLSRRRCSALVWP
jgi:CHAT domain-containing protein